MSKCKCSLLVLGAGVLWGATGLFFRQLTAMGLASLEVLLLRIGFAALFLGVVVAVKNPRLFRIHRRDIPVLLGAGVFTFMAFFCYFSALSHTTMAVACILLYTAPGFVVIFSAILFKEKITVRKAVALTLIFGGSVFSSGFFDTSQSITLIGLFWGVMSGLSYAMYSVFSRFSLSRGCSGFTVSFYAMAIGTVIALCVVDLPAMAVKMTLPVLSFGMCIGGFCAMLPFLLYTLGMSGMETGEASMLSTVELVVAALLGVVVLSEPMTGFVFLGVLLILGGIAVMNVKVPLAWRAKATAAKQQP